MVCKGTFFGNCKFLVCCISMSAEICCRMNTFFESNSDDHLSMAIHDFSWNGFSGSLSFFSFTNKFLLTIGKTSYRLLVNNNLFNGSLPGVLFSNCNNLQSFSTNLSANQISAQNHIDGSIPPNISSLKMLQFLNLSRNFLSGSLPIQLGEFKDLELISLQDNNLTGEIPTQLGQLTSLMVLDLSQNALIGSTPGSLVNATSLQVVLVDHNRFSGEIPASFSKLLNLIQLDLSFNNLQVIYLIFNMLPVPLKVQKWHSRSKLKSFVMVMAISTSFVLFVLVVIVLFLLIGSGKLSRLTSLKKKVVVTFAYALTKLNYDNVVREIENFSICNLIGTGGFGSTYKAELVPGFLVAVKRLSIGRFQGIRQFNAKIRTLGRKFSIRTL
ncbi:hypothetical protein HYC85_005736 [Camellia sinensis]|uniref:Protein kinase domain-containing protein n=1 Tax=Camellia sinensis TaxID=4442 RepID=A0A7J7I1U3_CAMSI|nr:hypothetical protein HYC85_005736 [Camellia sinensis]